MGGTLFNYYIKEFNMKCVKSSSGKIERVGEEKAFRRVKSGEWSYCGKAEWRKEVRDKE